MSKYSPKPVCKHCHKTIANAKRSNRECCDDCRNMKQSFYCWIYRLNQKMKDKNKIEGE